MYHYYRVGYPAGETSLYFGEYSTTSIYDDNYTEISEEEYLALTDKVIYFYKIVDDSGNTIGVQAGGGRMTDFNYIEILPPEYIELCEQLDINPR